MPKKKEDLFANPFSLTHNDRRQLDDFFDDGSGNGGGGGLYEEVNCHDDHGSDNNGTSTYHNVHSSSSAVEQGGNINGGGGLGYLEDYEYDDENRNRRRRRGKSEDDTLGSLMPNMFSTSESGSINVIWMTVLTSMLFFLGAYYGLGKQQSEKARAAAQQVVEGAANKDLNTVPMPNDVVPSNDVVAKEVASVEDAEVEARDSYHLFNMEGIATREGGKSLGEGVGPALTHEVAEKPKFTLNTQQANFDPFQLLQQPPTKIKDLNDWHGAPFVVSPPQLPIVNSNEEGVYDVSNGHGTGSSRLGYLQNPTIVNGTIVFSTEGDLYLTRLPENQQTDVMTAMKLTTTVGNALQPKLNPKNPHLLTYSATYSGVREVYLMDLRPCPPSSAAAARHTIENKMPMGAPGTPGGPALRLTYTPGGIRSVVGWDEDGSSILYSSTGEDVMALPDTRLFRLRISHGDNGVVDVESIGGEKVEGGGVHVESESPKKKDAPNNKQGAGKEKKESAMEKDEKHEPNQKQGAGEEKKHDNKKGVNENKGKKTEEWEDDDDDDGNDFSIAAAQEYVDKIAPPDNPGKIAANPGQSRNNKSGNNGDGNEDAEKATKKEDKDNQRKLERQERQRRHLLKLSEQKSRRRLGKQSSVGSIIEPVPLAQATEGVYHTALDDAAAETECIYFTRFKQSSSTKRYVGGAAESIWAYCADKFDDVAVPLTGDYNGTSKGPSVYTTHGDDVNGTTTDVLLFMSDRAPVMRDGGDGVGSESDDATEWLPSSMDLWAAPLPLSSSGALGTPVRLTNVACQFNGIDLSEYSVDPATGGVVLRIGADLHYLSAESIRDKLPTVVTRGSFSTIEPLPIAVYSDFSNMQERLIPLGMGDLTSIDAYMTSYKTVSTLLTARGQSFVAPVVENVKAEEDGYGGGGRNMPGRRYKVAPGTGGGGLTRILSATHIPQPVKTSAPLDSGERLALILATDPLSPTGEHAFYVIRTDAAASPAFGFAALFEYSADSNVADTGLPSPFLGGHLAGGSTKEGGLGSVYGDSVEVSPCGRRFAFTDTDGRIVVVTIPTSPLMGDIGVDMVVLPQENEISQPLVGDDETDLVWSPGGRYLAIVHSARNQFRVISIADLGPPEDGKLIALGRIVQATTDRFNSFSPVWGHASKDFVVELWTAATSALDPNTKAPNGSGGATALLYLSDRDVQLTGNTSPWGTRAPSPTFEGNTCVHVLPLQSKEDAIDLNAINEFLQAPYGGGGAMEVAMEGANELNFLLELMEQKKKASAAVTADAKQNNTDEGQPQNATDPTADENENSAIVIDTPISFGEENDESFSFARSSYRIDHIPEGDYVKIVCQLADNPSLLLLTTTPMGYSLSLFAIGDWPTDGTELHAAPSGHVLQDVEMSTDGMYILTILNGKLKVTPRQTIDVLALFADNDLEENIANAAGLHLNVWPNLEFQQMYKDAWRMLRDYFYDRELHSVDWDDIFDRYLPLVERCAKREELDDVLKQMIGELSALHSFVYGGEYPSPYHGDAALFAMNNVATLGAILQRSVENRGYLVVDIPERDPDFHMIDGEPMYSPLSNQVLKLSGQAGLKPGDVIVAVNHENVMDVPDIHMLLRNMAGESVRLDVLRMESTSKFRELREAKRRLLQSQGIEAAEGRSDILPEPLVVVPMSSGESGDLAYAAWEWKTRSRAKSLAAAAGFSIGYAHLRDMSGASSMDSFVRGFYPDYNKDALIIDVRNNHGGNIDSWLLDVLQRTAWMYWEGRSSNITTGGLGWDMQYAFRGHLVVLINEHTSSDGEGFARGVSELGLGKLVGKRTWGGGIWLSSDNRLVDGGIASAPEVGTYNDNFGWGLGVEQMGVKPDVEVDNNPKSAFDGEDTQLERAISVLKEWLEEEPVALPKDPGHRKDMNKKEGVDDGCSA